MSDSRDELIQRLHKNLKELREQYDRESALWNERFRKHKVDYFKAEVELPRVSHALESQKGQNKRLRRELDTSRKRAKGILVAARRLQDENQRLRQELTAAHALLTDIAMQALAALPPQAR